MSKLRWQGGTVLLAVLITAATVTVGSPRRSPRPAPPSYSTHTTALVTTCPTGLVPWPLAEVKLLVLTDLPDGGTIGIMGQSAHNFVPCSWWVDFTAQPPSSLVDQLARGLWVYPWRHAQSRPANAHHVRGLLHWSRDNGPQHTV